MKKSILVITSGFLVMLGFGFAYNPCQEQYGIFATMSVYDHEVCVCLDGYTFNRRGTKCISEREALIEQDEICQESYGIYAKGNGYAMCTCKDGYVWNKDKDQCVTKNKLCQELYGSNSLSDGGDGCKCDKGYVWNLNGDRCITEDKSCQEQFGKNSISAPNNQCQCKSGYERNEKRTECINTTNLCIDLYGKYSVAGEEYGTCVCMKGYDWNKSQTECISISSNKSCQERYGEFSLAGEDGCICKDGYSWNLSQTACIKSSSNYTPATTAATTTNNGFTTEQNEAYAFAYANKITTMPTIEQANMNGEIIRAEIAKMFANWVKSLGFEPDTSAKCNFTDISGVKGDLYPAIIESCQLGIMGQGITKFRPYDNITRGEVATAISRILWGHQYDGGSPYYMSHLNALKYVGVLSDINNPDFKELRGNVMSMLMRASDKIDLDTLNTEIEMEHEYNNEDDNVNYNDKVVDITSSCIYAGDEVIELIEDDSSSLKEKENATNKVINTCKTSIEQLNKVGAWKGDSSLKDGALKVVALEAAYYQEYLKILPYLGIDSFTTIQKKEFNSLSAKLDELDAKLQEANNELIIIQQKFAKKFGFDLEG